MYTFFHQCSKCILIKLCVHYFTVYCIIFLLLCCFDDFLLLFLSFCASLHTFFVFFLNQLSRYLFDWSSALSSGSLLKKSVDCVLCAFCHISPPYFQHVLEWLNIQGSDFTDDSKGFAQPVSA